MAISLGLQTLWPYSLTKPYFSYLGYSSGHVLSKMKSVNPHFFYISDITNSLSYSGKSLREKSMLESFCTNVLKGPLTDLFELLLRKIYSHITSLFQTIKKFVISWKKHDFEKGMHSCLSNIGFDRNLSKKARFNEKPHFL